MDTMKAVKAPEDWLEWKVWAAARMTQPDLPDLLRRWLAGHDLPLDDSTVEPQDWILQALPLGFARERPLAGLTSAAANLLENAGALMSPKEIYGLLQLAAGLAQPVPLACALNEFLNSTSLRKLGKRSANPMVAGRPDMN